MTRQEFIDNVIEWYELKSFCYDNDCEICEDIYDEDGMDEVINYSIREYVGDYSWHELRDELRSIPSGYDYYRPTKKILTTSMRMSRKRRFQLRKKTLRLAI